MSPSPATPRRRLTATHLLIAIFVLGFVAALGAAFVERLTGAELHLWLMLLLLPAALAFSLMWWRRLDEAAREAHKWAWYWGASAGVIAAIPLLYNEYIPQVLGLANSLGFMDRRELISFGVISVFLLQAIGYLVAWIVWWARRR